MLYINIFFNNNSVVVVVVVSDFKKLIKSNLFNIVICISSF